METNIYAITDSHQESSHLSRLLSEIYRCEKNNTKPFLLFDSGDLFKGIYDKDLSVNAYLKLKELLPQAEIFITLGNNDFGFNKNDFQYLKSTVEKFNKAGITFVCGNLTGQETGKSVDWVPKYKIIEINNRRILITGFCVNNSCVKKFGLELIQPELAFTNLINSINESYDKIIILNHHWYTYSKALKDYAKNKGINIDLIIGGHEHSPIKPDYDNNIFYPLAFARTLYKMTLDEDIKNIEEINFEELDFIPEFEQPIIEYEEKTQLKTPIARRVLNLTKCYSDACPLGTFISDKMKEAGNTDIAFHSTGYTMYPLRLEDSDVITKYDLEQVMCATSTLEKIDINVEQLKKVFENATLNRMYKSQGNSKFVQCSQNITITGKGNPEDKTYKILQIEINGEKLLDENQNPIDKNRTFSCTIDPYIGAGEQGFEVLKNIPKTKILENGKEIKMNELFYKTIINAEKEYKNSTTYPSFKLIDIDN